MQVVFLPVLDSVDAAIGGAVGGGVGAYVGSELGGHSGAVIGGALGGNAGAAVATDGPGGSIYVAPAVRVMPKHNDQQAPAPPSYFCPPGQAK